VAPVTTVGSAVSDRARQQMYEERKAEIRGGEREKWQRKHSWEQRSEEEDRKIKAGELRESKSLTSREFRGDPGSGGTDQAFLHQKLNEFACHVSILQTPNAWSDGLKGNT